MRMFKDVQRAIIRVIVDYHTERVPFKMSDSTISGSESSGDLTAGDITIVDPTDSPIDDLLSQDNPTARNTALEHLIDEACSGNERHKPLLQYLVHTGLGLLDKLSLITTATPEDDIKGQKAAFKMFVNRLSALLIASNTETVVLENATRLELQPLSKNTCAPTDAAPNLVRQLLAAFGATETLSLSDHIIDLLFLEHLTPQLKDENGALRQQLATKVRAINGKSVSTVAAKELPKAPASNSEHILSRLLFTGSWGLGGDTHSSTDKSTGKSDDQYIDPFHNGL